MLKSIRIRLAKKDVLIKNWWEFLSKNQINISQTITYAIQYYAKTGEYLRIGSVQILEKEFEPISRKIYIQETSEAYKWLEQRQECGEKVSTAIKRVLRNSLEESEELSVVKELDQIIDEIENLSRVKMVPVLNQTTYETSLPQTQPTYQEKESKIEVPKVLNEEEVEKEAQKALDKLFKKKDEEEEIDLIGSLMTHTLKL